MSIEKKHTDGMSRRGFLKTATASAAALAGCGPADKKPPAAAASAASAPAQKERYPNLFKTLAQYEFKGQDGKPVSIAALELANRDKRSTLSFSFDGCAIFCPPNNFALSQIEKSDKNLIHYVINVNPELDGSKPELRDRFMETFTKAGVDPSKIVMLYPKNTDVAHDIAWKLGFIGPQEGSKADSHYASITLYEAGGKYRDRQLATDAVKVWKPILEAGVKR